MVAIDLDPQANLTSAFLSEDVLEEIWDDQVLILIEACIIEGIDTRAEIRAKLIELGFNGSHVVMLLNETTGDDPNRHRWHRDCNGHHCLHFPTMTT